MGILSIQSQVASGHVGNSAAVFPLRRFGHEVWPVPTVLFSNHPGHGSCHGPVLATADVGDLLDGLDERGCLEACDAVLLGYMGRLETARRALEACRRVRSTNADAVICCDPVMGDQPEGLYVDDGFVEFYAREASPIADVMFPNAFELETLTGMPVADVASAAAAARRLTAMGPAIVVATSVPADMGSLVNILAADEAVWAIETPRIPAAAKGAGDFLSALWLGRYLNGRDATAAFAAAVASTYDLVERSRGRADLSIVATQDNWMSPARCFQPVRFM